MNFTRKDYGKKAVLRQVLKGKQVINFSVYQLQQMLYTTYSYNRNKASIFIYVCMYMRTDVNEIIQAKRVRYLSGQFTVTFAGESGCDASVHNVG